MKTGKQKHILSLVTMVGCLLATIMLTATASSTNHPNLVVILSDDVGWGDLGCYGATKIKTPHLDRLAREGLRFTDAHASAAVCTPTRYSLLTGEYSWRQNAVGLNKGVANGDSPLLIPVGTTTLPSILKTAGYRTAAVGKWHLGFGNAAPDYNQELKPGPMEIGFDEFFGFPATNDRMPPVYVRGHRVVGLDPNDPIRYSYNAANAAAGKLGRSAAGRQRIGWMSGGKAAFWKDEDIADTFTREAVAFVERNKANPFFLYFAPHDVHPPTISHRRFVGTSGLGPRADMMQELDWSVGEILNTLDRLGLATNTLVIFSSDNGASPMDEQGHRPNGPWRGKKSQLWEGGHREPFLARWPGRITPGVSDALVCLVDLPATAAALVGQKLSATAAPDSFNLLPTLLGQPNAHPRDHLVVMSGKGDLAIRQGPWKYIPDLHTANGWQSVARKAGAAAAGPGLFNLTDDPGETKNLNRKNPEAAKRLAGLLKKVESAKSTRP
jgi:arylsulfatase A-like enzyme